MKWFINAMMVLSLFLTVEGANAQLAKKLGKGFGRSVKFAKDRHQGAVKFGKKQLENRKERKAKRKDRRKQRRQDFKAGYQDSVE
jgi:hypothetical protein